LGLWLGGLAVGEERQGFISGAALPTALPPPKPIEISIKDAVLRALRVNYDVSIQRLSADISRADLLGERGKFEPALFGEAGRTGANASNATDNVDSGKVGLRTRWLTGAELSLSSTYQDNSGSTGGVAGAVAELRQPLLRGAGIKVNRAGIVMARRNLDIALQDLKRQMIDTASAVQDQYWGLVAARERVAVQEDSLKFARDLADLTVRRAAAGIVGDSDTVEARAAVYAREADVARAAEDTRALEDALKEELVLLDEPGNWTAAVVPTTPPTLPETDTDFLKALRDALASRPDYEAELLQLKNADLSLYVAKNQILPRLDLAARGEREAGVEGPGSTFDAVSRDDETVCSAFLSIEIPLGNKAARAERDKAGAVRDQELLRIKQLELRIIREVRRAVDALNTSRKVVDATTKAVEFETRKLDNERTKLALGKSTTDNVVRYIESLNGARLSHIQAVVDYNRALARREQVQGTTLNQYGVTIE
jgi:outer membrane protein